MAPLSDIDIDDILMAMFIGIICALPLAITLWFNGINILDSAIFGLLTGSFVGLAILSDEYKLFRVLCALIVGTAAIKLSLHAQFSMPVTILVVSLGVIIGYFARKWVDILTYVS